MTHSGHRSRRDRLPREGAKDTESMVRESCYQCIYSPLAPIMVSVHAIVLMRSRARRLGVIFLANVKRHEGVGLGGGGGGGGGGVEAE